MGRWFVLLTAVAVATGACYWAFGLERQSLAVKQRSAEAAGYAHALETSVTGARRALAAMASPGQAAVSWSRQASGALASAREQVVALSGVAPEAMSLATSTDALDRLVEAEARVRDYAVSGKTLMASDVAFGEALPLLDAMQAQTTEAVNRVAAAADSRTASLRNQQVLGVSGALLALLCALLALVWVPRAVVADVSTDSVQTGPSSLGPMADDPAERRSPSTGSAPSTIVDVEALASVCAELATLTDAADLPGAVGRMAHAISASGVVVWIADAERRVLTAVASSGYDAKVVARFGDVPFDDANPTSRAYVTGIALTTAAGPGRSSAIAVPIAGPRGAIGVLSAELSTSMPQGDVTAATRIAAAQLATLLGAPPTRSTDARAQG